MLSGEISAHAGREGFGEHYAVCEELFGI